MPQTFLIFNFGTDEEAAQKARHKIEGWKQGFRLGNKMLLKFEREENTESAKDARAEEKSESRGKKRAAAKNEEEKNSRNVKILVRLDFSDHEKLSRHRWVERIPAEEPFKFAQAQIVGPSDDAFAKTAGQFDSLD
jgi:hypothetical protein